MGGYYVFPGGTVHPSDYSARMLERCRGLAKSDAQKILGNRHEAELALGHWIAGVRELFEEVGILLCQSRTSAAIDLREKTTREKFEAKRQAIVRDQLDFGSFLESEDLYCDLSHVVYFFHRVTPSFYPMRFDTRFYLALLPVYQTPLASSEEVTRSLWIKPAEALSEVYDRDFPILPPTTTVLEDLAALDSWEAVRSKYRLP